MIDAERNVSSARIQRQTWLRSHEKDRLKHDRITLMRVWNPVVEPSV